MTLILISMAVLWFLALSFYGKAYWGLLGSVVISFFIWRDTWSSITFLIFCSFAIGVLLVIGLPLLRRPVSKIIMKLMAKSLPPIGATEDIALKAGTVWWEGELFSGSPDWGKMLAYDSATLTQEEQDFLLGPVQELCAMLNEEEIAQHRELSEAVWTFIKEKRFLGIVIEKEYGGLGFSAAAHAAIISRISTVSIPAAITVMVPNSLGPGELLHHYGTSAQKQHYLPGLAIGREIPCFALTEPHAGSDAANGRSIGIVCRSTHEGKEVLGIKLDFNKRYITLAPVATVIGLAFNLFDPEHLLGDIEDIGITCALLPRDTKGLEVGEHHDPMGVPFNNGPVRGKGVFIPLDYVIGGEDCVGQGWRMLMESLAVGRSISLPSLSIGASQLSTRVISAYALLREQFGLPISKFEGVRDPLARIFASSYWMTAARDMTCGAIDSGEKPAVASAIMKCYLTDTMRKVVNDAMDIQAGAAICRGPRNIFSRIYESIPIAITVEGANILTRSLIVFGQGAMRCHPYLLDEINALHAKDSITFDRLFSGHVNHVIKNGVRAFVYALSFARFISIPDGKQMEGRHYQRLTRLSAAFAFVADIGLLTLGGALKRKEFLSGRYADALAWLYIGSASLKRFHLDQRPQDWALLDYTLTRAEREIEYALSNVMDNLPNRPLAWFARLLTFPLGRHYRLPVDRQLNALVDVTLDPQYGQREHLTEDVFIPTDKNKALGRLEATYQLSLNASEAHQKVNAARRQGKINKDSILKMAAQALQHSFISDAEHDALLAAEAAIDDLIQVDYFAEEEYKNRR